MMWLKAVEANREGMLYRITGWLLRLEGLWKSCGPTLLLQQGHLEQVACQYLQGWTHLHDPLISADSILLCLLSSHTQLFLARMPELVLKGGNPTLCTMITCYGSPKIKI